MRHGNRQCTKWRWTGNWRCRCIGMPHAADGLVRAVPPCHRFSLQPDALNPRNGTAALHSPRPRSTGEPADRWHTCSRCLLLALKRMLAMRHYKRAETVADGKVIPARWRGAAAEAQRGKTRPQMLIMKIALWCRAAIANWRARIPGESGLWLYLSRWLPRV